MSKKEPWEIQREDYARRAKHLSKWGYRLKLPAPEHMTVSWVKMLEWCEWWVERFAGPNWAEQ